MSFVHATVELVEGAVRDLAGIGSSLADAAAAVRGPTTGIAAAAQDEISSAIAALFADVGRQFQADSLQAHAFHSEFVSLLAASGRAYSGTEFVNARQLLPGGLTTLDLPAAAAGVDPISHWGQVIATTTQNAETVFGAWDSGVATFGHGVSAGLGRFVTDPIGLVANLRSAVQSVTLVGAPGELASAVTQHTLGGITQSIGSETVDVVDAHGELYRGLLDGFLPEGSTGELLTAVLNFAASPLSGLAIGALGPFVSPGVALLNSVSGVYADLAVGNGTGALHGVLNIPANVFDGFFNGAALNLDPLAPVVNQFFAGPGAEEHVTGLSFGFGGLLSPGQVVTGAGGPMYGGVGGSFLNSVGLHLTFNEADGFVGVLPIPALALGPVGAAANFLSVFGQALGPGLVPPPPSLSHEH